ncbi:MAG: GNAT family N-acetyltransferase [Pseudonocardiaceae bacterium]
MEKAGPVVRLGENRWRESYDLFMTCLHLPPTSEERWQQVSGLYRPDRVFGILHQDAVVGTAMSTPMEMVLPGGRVAPVAGSTSVGVHSDHTRRGMFTAMMSTRMNELAEQGEIFLAERPSAATLYLRWGSGPATFTRTVQVNREHTALRPDLTTPTQVWRVPAGKDLRATVADAHARAAAAPDARPGMVHRTPAWWECWDPYRDAAPTLGAAICEGTDGVLGYVTWMVDFEGADVARMRRVLTVLELVAGTAEAACELWRYLGRLDLVEEIRAPGRPVDEAVPLLFADQRACHAGEVLDEMWLRVLDVPAALQARRWGKAGADAAVTVEVRDEQLSRNTGRYRISADGADRVTTEPELTMPVSALAMAYLGGTSPSQLAATGLLQVHDRSAVPVADLFFATPAAPWCGSMF